MKRHRGKARGALNNFKGIKHALATCKLSIIIIKNNK